MDVDENHEEGPSQKTMRSSLRPPSKIIYMGSALSETSGNSRIPAPDTTSLKHKPSNLPEPTPKRKTLAERAGESARGNTGPFNASQFGSSVRGQSVTSLRSSSLASSTSSRPPPASVSGRHVSSGSFSANQSGGTRTTQANARARSQTALDHQRPSNKATKSRYRPGTSLEDSSSIDDNPALGKRKEWDTKGRLEDVEHLYENLCGKMDQSQKAQESMEEIARVSKAKIDDLETIKARLTAELEASKSHSSTTTNMLQADLSSVKEELRSVKVALDDEQRNHRNAVDDLSRQSRTQLESQQRKARDEIDDLIRAHRNELADLEKNLQRELEAERKQRSQVEEDSNSRNVLAKQNAEEELEKKNRELEKLKDDIEAMNRKLDQEKSVTQKLRDSLAESSTTNVALETRMRSVQAHVDFLESDSKSQAQSFVDLEQRMQDAIASAAEANHKLRTEETMRRKLHNQVQELKGNIRVFCRVRPSLNSDNGDDLAKIVYPGAEMESRELEVMGPEEKSSLGTVTCKKNSFAFDHVFGPSHQNDQIFDEISQLVQSALDGYNVCIFCYGQTGSGKTYTMSSKDGMIPQAVQQIYETAQGLEEKGWKYTMEGSFVEVYNENLNDLLGKPEDFDKKKHEIRHDEQKCKTYVSDLSSVQLDSPDKVETILQRASSNRSVAATKANERSSRSHCVFMLRLLGENSSTGEKSEGTLNLVDLAGSERLSHSGATGDRLKETQNINKSLSCLGDVIGALGRSKEGSHIPYRNSKLTYLLQYSLGGNSKTLMFVMVSPLQTHLSESLTSLKFATKVHNTHIGTAKKQTKMRDS